MTMQHSIPYEYNSLLDQQCLLVMFFLVILLFFFLGPVLLQDIAILIYTLEYTRIDYKILEQTVIHWNILEYTRE